MMMMSSISMVEAKLPPGFRFHPRDEELICNYLMNKVLSHHSDSCTLMIDVDLNKSEPWEIPESACVGGKEWYFYSQRDRKYATGVRTNRATSSGYWKATGKDRPVLSSSSSKSIVVGMRKTLVFYRGRAPTGTKTQWVMHEFRLHPPLLSSHSLNPKEDWVLCRVFYKSREMGAATAKAGSNSTLAPPSPSGFNSLPALMDDYVSFQQPHTHRKTHHDYRQVPCFSSNTHLEPNYLPANTGPPGLSPTSAGDTALGLSGMPNFDAAFCADTDDVVLKAVLSQLTKMESNPTNLEGSPSSLGEPSSVTGLSHLGVPNIWSPSPY